MTSKLKPNSWGTLSLGSWYSKAFGAHSQLGFQKKMFNWKRIILDFQSVQYIASMVYYFIPTIRLLRKQAF
jgi:hypothetical protein